MYADPQAAFGGFARGADEHAATTTSSSYHGAAAPAAAALAALASSRLSSAPGAADSAMSSQQYAARNYTPPQAPGSANGSSRGSLLLWNIKQPPQQQVVAASASAAGGQLASPVAGRRAAAPGQLGAGSSGSSRPSSQEAGNAGLNKLKALSTARLVRRLGTPPAGTLPSTQDSGSGSGTSGGHFGARPVAPAAAAGRGASMQHSHAAAEGADAALPWQQQQQQHSYAPQQQQQQQPQQKHTWPWSKAAPAQPQDTFMTQDGRGSSVGGGSSGSSSGKSSGPRQAPPAAAKPPPVQARDNSSSRSGGGGQQPAPAAAKSTGMFSMFNKQQQQQPLALGTPGQAAEYVEVERHPCASCGRCFAPAALQQHARVCDKVFGQKRKVFDVKSQRLQGTGVAAASRHMQSSRSTSGRNQQRGAAAQDKRPAVSATQAKKSKWQLQSEQLRAAMRPHSAAAGGGGYPGAAQVEEVEDTRVPCPHCGRRFAELVAERHIPKCADIIAKPGRLKAAGGKSAYMRSGSGSRR